MQQGSTICAARGNYSSWEHRRHYVEFSHLLQSNEAFLVAWISVSPDMPRCLKCLITTAGIFQLHSLLPQSCSCPVWWLWLIILFLIVFVFCRSVSFPNSFATSAEDWLLLGRRLHRTEPSWKVRWKAFEKSWGHFSSRWHHSKSKSISGQRLDHQRWRQICEPVTSDDTLLHQAKNSYITSTWNAFELHQAENL